MKILQILIFFAEMRTIKSENQIFHVISLNKDISITTSDIAMKFSLAILLIHQEGSESQIFLFRP